MEIQYNFHRLHEMANYEDFSERSHVAEFDGNFSISKTRVKRVCARITTVTTMQQ